MDKVVNPGSIEGHPVFCEIEISAGNLSITGVIGPWANGNAWGGCGQIVDSLSEIDHVNRLWTKQKLQDFQAIWDKWHLNDMRPSCEHQRDWEWDAKVTLTEYGWSDVLSKLRWRAAKKLSKREYDWFRVLYKGINKTLFSYPAPKYESEEIKRLLDAGWIEAKGTKEEIANWVHIKSHPDGILCKPCPVCGYRYGTAWIKEELPPEVIQFLTSLPDSEISLPGAWR